MGLEDDARLARERGLRFEVTLKVARGQRWVTVEADVDDLAAAVSKAAAIDAYETGVFVDGFIYWTSHHPDLLNTPVLTHELSK